MDDYSKYIIGAYATSPTLNEWKEEKEIEYYEEIKKNLNIKGLELPFWGTLHEYNEELFLTLLDKRWQYVVTTLPGTMKSLSQNPNFGVASDDEDGRKEAIKFLKSANAAIKKINDFFGEQKVFNVALATAPSLAATGVSSSSKALIKSLEELVTFDWQGAQIVIEHCDSGRADHIVKGFLSLEEEIEAVQYINKHCNQSIGFTVNWARSVLERRDVSTPKEHIKLLSELNLLKGLMFSGTSANSIDYGSWSDLHLPIAKESGISFYEESSLLTSHVIKDCLLHAHAQELNYLGVKVLSMPIGDSSMQRRIGLNRDTLKVVDKILKEIQ
ncbi:DUF4862 family protein [Sulfurimonas sp.]|uniref:DUF4862 family protein n=1 Tax=Sulfurimonas sp. TaxID=2022749 RepID=UPI003D0CA931